MLSVAKKINTRIDPNKVRIGRGFLVETIAVCIRQLGILEYIFKGLSIRSNTEHDFILTLK